MKEKRGDVGGELRCVVGVGDGDGAKRGEAQVRSTAGSALAGAGAVAFKRRVFTTDYAYC